MKKTIAFILTIMILLPIIPAQAETTITLWTIAVEGDANRAAYLAGIQAIEAAHPGLKIEMEATENEAYKTRIRAAMSAGYDLPDIFFTWSGFLEEFVDEGLVYCLDETLPEYKNELTDAVLANSTYDGKHYGVPLTMNVVTMFANMDMLEEVGCKAVPQSYDGLIALCEKLLEAGKIPFGIAGKENWCLSELIEPLVINVVGSEKLKELYEGYSSWDQASVIAAMDKFKQLKKYIDPNAAALGNEEVKQRFINGNYAFYQNGSWNCSDISSRAAFKVQACTFPCDDSRKTAQFQMIGGTNDTLAVSSTAKDPKLCAEIAFELGRFISREGFLNEVGLPAWSVNYDASSVNELSTQVADMISKSSGMVLFGDNYMTADEANTYLDYIAQIYAGDIDSTGYAKGLNQDLSHAISGTCGDNASWTYNEKKGTLQITGTGKVEYDNHYPFNSDNQVKKIIISEGITGIGNNVFLHCTNAIRVNLPKSLTSVGLNAFASCEHLKTVYFGGAPETKATINFAGGNESLLNANWFFVEEKVRAFVERCYQIILGRNADEAGLNSWVAALENGTAAASQIIDGFVKSDEYKNRNLSAGESVDILYNTMLDRPADEGGKAGWVDALSKGYSLQHIINGFCTSAEFAAICNGYGIEAGSVDAGPVIPQPGEDTPRGKIEAFVKRCYQLILNREADQGGLQGWSDALDSRTAAAAQIIDGFVRSEEYINRNLSAGESVDVLYKTMLDRAADEGGRIGWVDALSKGYTLQHIINGFCGSAEFTTICENFGIVAGSVAVSGTMVRREAIAPEGDEAEAPVVYKGYNSEFINEEKIRAFVEHCYVAVFGREGDAEGVENYTKLILDGKKTPKKVAYEFIFSSEFQEKLPGNEDFIRILYRLYFDREPGAEELAAWVQMLEGGATLEEIVDGFTSSAEFKGIVNGMKE